MSLSEKLVYGRLRSLAIERLMAHNHLTSAKIVRHVFSEYVIVEFEGNLRYMLKLCSGIIALSSRRQNARWFQNWPGWCFSFQNPRRPANLQRLTWTFIWCAPLYYSQKWAPIWNRPRFIVFAAYCIVCTPLECFLMVACCNVGCQKKCRNAEKFGA